MALDEDGPTDPRARVAAIDVRVAFDPRVNFALQQNAVPFVKQVTIENRSDADLTGLVVTLTTTPVVSAPAEIRIDRLAAGTTYRLESIDVQLRADALAAQTERESGLLHVSVAAGDQVRAELALPIEVLAYDEWNGNASLPEILAAFVLPNHPAVARVLCAARDILQTRTGDPSLDGYQSHDPKRVLTIAEAVYDALLALDLTYVNPPASFESTGQKVRTPDRIVESRMGTCLDLALFAAACLEQCGLHPLVVMVKGHAFAGLWLIEESFPEAATTEPYRVLKRVELDAIRVFETTGLASRPQMTFADAIRSGRRKLEDVDQFLFSLDVRSARRARIRPIPMRAATGDVVVVTEIRAAPRDGGEDLRPPGTEPSAASADAPVGARGRLDRWKRKLLDLSLRNRLLNYRESNTTIALLHPDVAGVEDRLAEGHALEVTPKPKLMQEADPRDERLHRGRTGEDALKAFVADELKAGRICTPLAGDDLDERLLEVWRSGRLSLEEGGSNTLYLAIGFLAWYETPSSEAPRFAPLLLVPVTLERRTVLDRFRLRRLDDDARVNVTLVQKLKAEWGLEVRGIDPLPEDVSGVDVAAVLRAFREAVLSLPRWHVKEDAAIGLFSFTKYLMWVDLEARHEVLARNAVVRHLLDGPGQAFDAGGGFPDVDSLDAKYPPHATFCALDADSSQLAAVHAAAQGRTFVLQGPPGTGKSQTITNLITQCLAEGQRVLFVSEKMAALDVVHRRLDAIGLGPFCLPLHSNKAQKREVLERLGETLDFGAQASPADWDAKAAELQPLREKLNAYSAALHAPRAFGMTAFRAVSQLSGLRDAREVRLDLGAPGDAAPDLPVQLRSAVAALLAEAREVGTVPGHPLLHVGADRWQPQLDADARANGGAVARAAEALGRAAVPVARAMGLAERPWSLSDIDRMVEWCDLLATAPAVPVRGLTTEPNWDASRAQAVRLIAAGRERDDRSRLLQSRYAADLLEAPLEAWQATLRKALPAWAPIRWWTARPVRKGLDALRVVPATATVADCLADIDEAIAIRRLDTTVRAPGSDAARIFGSAWAGGAPNWGSLDEALAWTDRLRTRLAATAGTALDERRRLREVWTRFIEEGRDAYMRDDRLAAEFASFIAAHAAFVTARLAFISALQIDEAAAFGSADAPDCIGRAVALGTRVADNAGRLRIWCGYQRARRAMVTHRLGGIIEMFESAVLPVDQVSAAFERSFHAWWLEHVLAAEPVLAEFSSTRHGLTIERFRALDQEMLTLTVGVVRARLSAALPRVDPNLSAKGEIGLLRREIQKKTWHMPLRRLFAQIPNALARLKPCMLMSPLSVAQYLSPDFAPFDLVVFDEASQIPVWDAVGAIARGERAVIVGDSKQLPPTSFFEKGDTDDEEPDEDDIVDLESILDECLVAGLPERTLDWHFRSKHESLIAFSNRFYYRSRLLTFPSVDRSSDRFGVSLRPVPDGVYDKGHSRTNRREAEAVVAEIVRRLRDPEESERTIGVVTFSMAQQTLVENLLEAARRRHPEIEPYFSAERREPLFVKNLENVQGDERDVILFSVCYGPDAQGRVYMSFGPLNLAGGERRLNVAITRAREQVVMFSTLRADQIDLARTRAVGVAHLKAYLEYAATGPRVLDDATASSPTGGDWESPLEEAVERALVERGWTVHRQVGCSGYRIDLAVTAPGRPGRYVLGIECDGAAYHSGRTARDRDRLRASVLRKLGWNLHRVWSTDWWHDPAREITRIEEALAKAVREEAERPPRAEPARVVEGVAEEAPKFASAAAAPPPAVSTGPPLPTYPPPATDDSIRRPEAFHERYVDSVVARTLRLVGEREAPITLDLAARRVAAIWGLGRVSERVVRRVEALVGIAGLRAERNADEIVLWRAQESATTFTGFRVPADPSAPERTAEQIPLVELAHAVGYVLEAHLRMSRADLARDVARLFGITRTGSVVRERMDLAIEQAVREGHCVRSGDDLVAAR